MPEVAAEPIQLPDDQGILWTQRFQTGSQARPRIMAARGEVLIAPVRCHPCGQKRIALQIEDLGAIHL